MKKSDPIKRSKQLTPLSREHHDALLFIWKIRKGLKNKTSSPVMIDYIKWFWNNNLDDHFDQEEKILLPHLAKDDPMAQRLREEHELIRNLIGEINENSVLRLADVLDDHIRFEERALFPHIEQTVPEDQLNEISSKLEHQPACQTKWSNEFWKE